MQKILNVLKHPIFVILAVLVIDQCVKIWIKLNMVIGDEFNVFGDWFIIHFTENPGMAFGLEFGGEWGKLALTLFRILAVTGIGYFLYKISKSASTLLKISVALIFAGAVGNIIDSIFYGVFFSDSYYEVATLFPEEGYASWFHGHVVDMLYFPIYEGYLPEWMPFWGGDYMVFFRPVFNIADTAISVGIGLVLVFERGVFFQKEENKEEEKPQEKGGEIRPE